jgi:signal transduction histidine kinase
MNKLFVFLRMINYAIVIIMLLYNHVSVSVFQMGLTVLVCLWGIWDFWKKPHDTYHKMRLGVWAEIIAITLWLLSLHNDVLLFAFISPLARASIHLLTIGRLTVYIYIIMITTFEGIHYSISHIWIQLLVFTLILIYSSVLSMLLKERDNARRLLALSAFEREQHARNRERVRMSRQLHDTMGQYWTSVIRALDVAEVIDLPEVKQEFLQKAKEAAVLGLEEMRKTVRNENDRKQTPEQWLEFGLQSLKRIQDLTNIGIQYQLEDIQWKWFSQPTDIAETLTRTMIEGVSNAIRHGKASLIKIFLQSKADHLRLIIRDNGVGFTEKTTHSEGMGLLSLRSLAEESGGKLVIDGSTFRGTTIFLSIPFQITN